MAHVSWERLASRIFSLCVWPCLALMVLIVDHHIVTGVLYLACKCGAASNNYVQYWFTLKCYAQLVNWSFVLQNLRELCTSQFSRSQGDITKMYSFVQPTVQNQKIFSILCHVCGYVLRLSNLTLFVHRVKYVRTLDMEENEKQIWIIVIIIIINCINRALAR